MLLRFQIKGLDKLVNVENLDLGSNKIRELKGLGHMKSLKELYIAKNKLTSI